MAGRCTGGKTSRRGARLPGRGRERASGPVGSVLSGEGGGPAVGGGLDGEVQVPASGELAGFPAVPAQLTEGLTELVGVGGPVEVGEGRRRPPRHRPSSGGSAPAAVGPARGS